MILTHPFGWHHVYLMMETPLTPCRVCLRCNASLRESKKTFWFYPWVRGYLPLFHVVQIIPPVVAQLLYLIFFWNRHLSSFSLSILVSLVNSCLYHLFTVIKILDKQIKIKCVFHLPYAICECWIDVRSLCVSVKTKNKFKRRNKIKKLLECGTSVPNKTYIYR